MAGPPVDLNHLQSQIDAHPGIQAAIQSYLRSPDKRGMSVAAVQQALQQSGIQLPHDYILRPDGRVVRQGFMERNPWAVLAMPAATAAAAPLIGGLGAGSGAGLGPQLGGGPPGAGLFGAPPYAGATAAGAGSGTAAATGATAGAGAAVANAASGMPWADILRVGAPLATSLLGRAFGGGGDVPNVQGSEELNEMLRLAMDRMRAQQPLSDALNRQALAGLPSYARGNQ